MPCSDAMIKNVVYVHPNDTVAKVMALFEERHFHSVAVVDDDGIYVGLFSLRTVLNQLLPVSVRMADGLENLDFIIGASPGVAKRLRKMQTMTMADVMERDAVTLYADTHTWEAIRVMAKYGSPIPIVEEKTNRFVGMISSQSMMENLRVVLKQVEAEEQGEA